MGVTAVATALIGSSASRSAANAQERASKEASAVQERMLERILEVSEPWRNAGASALGTLQSKLSAGPGEFTKSPGYGFRLNEGINALEQGAAARGNLFSGAQAKALTRYGQDYATNDYQNFLNRYYQSLNPYLSLAGLGQQTISSNANSMQNAANQIGANTIYGGQARASGYLGSANAITGAMQNFSNALNGGANNYMMAAMF